MKTVYLAGPITGLDYNGCTDWREYAISVLAKDSIIGVSPMRAKEYLSKEKVISNDYDTVMSCQKGITTRDRYDTITRDVFLANLLGTKSVSIGTMIEFGWADLSRKPIITIMEREGNLHDHGIVRELTGFRVETLEEGLHVAKTILNF